MDRPEDLSSVLERLGLGTEILDRMLLERDRVGAFLQHV